MLEFCNHSWFCLRWRATARYTFGTMNAQISGVRADRPQLAKLMAAPNPTIT
jgi:hypothetical protein